eukprot:10076585-Lingulodinium_polyedra.AAC.1
MSDARLIVPPIDAPVVGRPAVFGVGVVGADAQCRRLWVSLGANMSHVLPRQGGRGKAAVEANEKARG